MVARSRIQNFLRLLGLSTEFPVVQYDPQTGEASLSSAFAKPTTSLCNETSSSFVPDTLMGRRETRQRASWTFELLLAFDQEVSLEEFEIFLTDPVLRLPSDAATGYSKAAVRLLRTDVTHPVQQQPAGGTKAKFLFEVEPPRV